jgi:hypothetical protein
MVLIYVLSRLLTSPDSVWNRAISGADVRIVDGPLQRFAAVRRALLPLTAAFVSPYRSTLYTQFILGDETKPSLREITRVTQMVLRGHAVDRTSRFTACLLRDCHARLQRDCHATPFHFVTVTHQVFGVAH